MKRDRSKRGSSSRLPNDDPQKMQQKISPSVLQGRTSRGTRPRLEYDPSRIEPYWQSVWESKKIYQPSLETAKKPYYNLHMFPYPSAEGLHVGNVYAFTGADIHGRFKRMQGYDVFQPFGLDGFGIHSENYALRIGSHPMDQAKKSEKRFYHQVHSLGSGYDWSHSLETYDPDYYKWTQWLFIELFKAGLAYREKLPVNFCPSCKTVLADEQVIDGQCERCGTLVAKRDLEQWLFRITEYADRLLHGLDQIDWPEKIKIAQRNWIGRSEGAKITFRVIGTEIDLGVFTTRPDTLYGATFLVVAPEHPVVENWLHKADVREYVAKAQQTLEHEKRGTRGKTGVFTGAYALNPVTNQQMPIWIADYVLMSYGTGAIMAVPAHDERDYEFARAFKLPIIEVVKGGDIRKKAYTGEGELVNSGEWNGLRVPHDIHTVIDWLEKRGIGQRFVQYHLRDWLISRQRYWGPPIPMIFCPSCAKEGKSWFTSKKSNEHKILFPHINQTLTQVAGWYPEENLPVTLPRIEDYKPLGTGKAPLASHKEFYQVSCPECGREARRETDVSDTFLDSGWYFLRYLATDLPNIPFPQQKESLRQFKASEKEQKKAFERLKWLPVTIYTGGAEHAVLHLLYTRFLYKVLADLGYIDANKGDEPFPKFYAHGLIIKDGAKMSKSRGNVVVPDEYMKKFGSDTLRTYLMFLGPFSMGGDFRDTGVEGMYRFIKRVWTLVTTAVELQRRDFLPVNASEGVSPAVKQRSRSTDPAGFSQMHKTIKGVTEDIEGFRFNTAIAKIMTYYNYLSKKKTVKREELEILVKLLAPFAPHITEELWQRLRFFQDRTERVSLDLFHVRSQELPGAKTPDVSNEDFQSIHTSAWPVYDPLAITGGDIVIAVQVNGKLRGTLRLRSEQARAEKEVTTLAQKEASVAKHLEGKTIRKVIYVPAKIVNFVVS